jgi:acyl dehydratase
MEEPLFFDDVEVGQCWRSPARTIHSTDVAQFAELTGDDNPLHLDDEFARQTPFGKPIAHGLLGMSLVAGLGSRSPWMHTAVFLRVVDWRFLRPIYLGDTVYVETILLEKRPAGRRRGMMVWKRQLINQHQEVVQEGTAETLVLVHSLDRHKMLPR